MAHIRLLICALTLFVGLPIAANAQQPAIAPDGIRNAASNALGGMPNSGIAQGSLVIVHGTNLGPASLIPATSFPLPSSQGLAGTSIRVTVGSTTVDAIVLFTSAGQVAALLPSSTPVGDGTLTVTYNGQTSAPAPITVVRSSFGIFSMNQAGSGPGVIQNLNVGLAGPVNTLSTVARPGQEMILWGTGIGPVSGNEAAGALPGNLTNINARVWVGVREAEVRYRGRADCCVGIDQIIFTVPEGVEGCYVPVAVQIDNIVSNYTSIAIAATGDTCSDPTGFSSAEVAAAKARGRICLCSVNLTRVGISINEPGLPSFDFNTDIGGTSCNCFTFAQFQRSQGICVPPAVGSCIVRTFQAGAGASDPVTGTGLNAGPLINVGGPNGAKQLTPDPLLPGFYSAILSGFPDPFGGGSADYLDPGTYSIDNGGGASGANSVGAFQASHTVPPSLVWTNQDAITAVNRAQGVVVTWTGGSPESYVGIYGSSTNALSTAGAAFVCFENASAGSFTIPPSVLLALPASNPDPTQNGDILALGSINPPTRFSAAGLDTGFVNSSVQTAKVLPYE